MRVALTGATGFIGTHIVRLLLQGGHETCALVRDPVTAQARLGSGVTLVRGDLDDTDALRTLVAGADAVVHLAGVVRGRCQRDFDRVNVDGTARLCDVLAAEVRLVLMSSLAAREPALSFYAASKNRAEQLAQERREAHRLVIVRPPAVYGPGDTEMLPVFRFMALTGRAPVAGDIRARFSLIHVHDLAAAAIALLATTDSVENVYTLHDGNPGGHDWDDLCATAGDICGRRIRPWQIPRTVLDLVTRANRAAASVLRYAPMLTPEKLRELRHPDWVCDNAAIQRDTAWQPALTLRDGLLATPGWH